MKELSATITESQEAQLVAAENPEKTAPEGTASEFGLRVKDLNSTLAKELGLDANHGVVIASVEPGSSADQAGLRARDVVLEVNRAPVSDVDAYQAAIKAGAAGKVVLLLVKRAEGTLFFAIKPQS